MDLHHTSRESFKGIEVSARFRRFIEERVARLERDAAGDEAQICSFQNADHIRRQKLLVAAQLEEAMRMRRFLEGARTRPRRAFIAR